MSHKNFPESVNDVLNSCIQIESARISRHVTIPSQICFCLNAELLEQVGQIKANQSNQHGLCLSASNLADLRYYALSNLPLKQGLSQGQSALTFSTEYFFDSAQVATTLFRSVIDLEGKISQEIKQELIQNPSLLAKISEAHYWLLSEILAQLPLKSRAWYSWLIFGCLAIASILISSLVWYILPLNHLLKLVICLSIFFLLKSTAKILVTKYLKSWIIYHLLDGLLAKGTIKRRLGLNILSFLD